MTTLNIMKMEKCPECNCEVNLTGSEVYCPKCGLVVRDIFE